MIMNLTVSSSIEINCLLDLPKLKVLVEELKLKINKSQIARELGVDRRLIDIKVKIRLPKLLQISGYTLH